MKACQGVDVANAQSEESTLNIKNIGELNSAGAIGIARSRCGRFRFWQHAVPQTGRLTVGAREDLVRDSDVASYLGRRSVAGGSREGFLNDPVEREIDADRSADAILILPVEEQRLDVMALRKCLAQRLQGPAKPEFLQMDRSKIGSQAAKIGVSVPRAARNRPIAL